MSVLPLQSDSPLFDSFSAVQLSRILYGASDFHAAIQPEELYEQFGQLLFELMGHSSFTLFFPQKLENTLKPAYSTFSDKSQVQKWNYSLESPLLDSILEVYQSTGMILTDSPEVISRWDFPACYCALLKDEQTILGLLVIHEGINPAMLDDFSVIEILEPIIRHFTQALMRMKSQEEVERSLDETNAKLLAINEIGELMGQLDLDTLLSKIVSLALQLTRAEVGNLMILDGDQLKSRVEWGLSDEVVKGIAWRDDGLMVKQVLSHHVPILIDDLQNDFRFVIEQPSRLIHSIASLPLHTRSKDLGVLTVVNTKGGESFSPENMATLQTVAGLASTAIENALLHREAIEREVFREQLRIARQIWENILPHSIPAFPGASISARSVPASVVGGDFYDFIPLDSERLGLVIADVSGKGIPAAMIMNMAKTILHIEAAHGNSPGQVLDVVNNHLVEFTKLDSFVTLIYAVIDRKTKRLLLSNAGHNPCVVYRASTGQCEEVPTLNMPLAILPDQEFHQSEVQIEPGDFLVLYTDGITEAMNRRRELFGMQNLMQTLQDADKLHTAEEIVQHVFDGIESFAGEAPQHDDTTIVVLKIESL